MRILVTGAGGMLGKAIQRVLEHTPIEWRAFNHGPGPDEFDITCWNCVRTKIHPEDVVINCAGVHRYSISDSKDRMSSVNGVGPHMLARHSDRVVHVSTDCVYSERGPGSYNEQSHPDPVDHYGITKYVGELTGNTHHLTIRCSFVGLTGSLLGWLMKRPFRTEVQGWTAAYWNGLHVDDFAYAIVHLALSNQSGVRHVYGANWNKHDLLTKVAKIVRPDLTIVGSDEVKVNRLLTSEYPSPSFLHPYPQERLLNAVRDEFLRITTYDPQWPYLKESR